MRKLDAVESWIDNVAYSHSRSLGTEKNYRRALRLFCSFIGKQPEEILAEYEKSEDREFRRKYARFLRAFISGLMREGYVVGSVSTYSVAVKSFFKYNDLPLGHVPAGRTRVIYHNRDMAKSEVVKVLEISSPRDRAFFCIMAQSGLRPETLCNLKMKNLQPDFKNGTIPCKIDVPQEIAKGKYRSYFTFIGEESVRYLNAYLATRPGIGPESYVFTKHGSEKKFSPSNISHSFKRAIRKLKEKGLIDFEQRKGRKPGELRLYNLRKFFRKYAHQAGFEIVQFWMGHIVSEGVDEHYRPRDVKFHRQLYREKAMPFLRLETATPSETDRIIAEQAEEIDRLKRKVAGYENMDSELAELKALTKKLLKRVDTIEKQGK